jgi:hypothetical protein
VVSMMSCPPLPETTLSRLFGFPSMGLDSLALG